MLKVKYKQNVDEVVQEIADLGHFGTDANGKTLDLQPEEINEGELIDINEESNCDKKDKDILGEVTSAINFMLKKLREIFHDI